MRNADIEITNRCNALCNFCPRDRMPALGGMSEAVYSKVLERLAGHHEPVFAMFCGFGEPTLHPSFEDYVSRARKAGLGVGVTTNASLLDRQRSRDVLDAGLQRIVFSISDLGDDYEEVYNLSFSRTIRNIEAFLEENRQRGHSCDVWVSLVIHDTNRDKIEAHREFWRTMGINNHFLSEENNRAGSLDQGNLYQSNDRFQAEAQTILARHGIAPRCMIPFYTISIGWEGRYLLCCMDWEKRMPLGHVAEHSIADIDRIKQESMDAGNSLCRDCSVNPLNPLREKLLEAGTADVAPESIQKELDYARYFERQHKTEYERLSKIGMENSGKSG